MQIEVLGCYGGESPDCRLTCLLVDEHVALDAGCLSQALSLERQFLVDDVLLSHSHIDHTNGLPFFLDNVYGRSDEAVDVHSSASTLYAVRKNLFNPATWPDFSRLPDHLLPAARFHELGDELPIELGGVVFTPIPVNHLVPTHGFLMQKEGVAVLWSSDTGPTERLWEVANTTLGLTAVCIDVSFHNEMQAVANESGHLTPQTLALELEKLEVDVPVLVHHVKPACLPAVRREIKALGNPSIEFLEQGRTYRF